MPFPRTVRTLPCALPVLIVSFLYTFLCPLLHQFSQCSRSHSPHSTHCSTVLSLPFAPKILTPYALAVLTVTVALQFSQCPSLSQFWRHMLPQSSECPLLSGSHSALCSQCLPRAYASRRYGTRVVWGPTSTPKTSRWNSTARPLLLSRGQSYRGRSTARPSVAIAMFFYISKSVSKTGIVLILIFEKLVLEYLGKKIENINVGFIYTNTKPTSLIK